METDRRRAAGAGWSDDAEQRALLERAGGDEQVKREHIELGEGVGVVHDEGREGGDCQREVERRPRVVLQRRDEREEAGEASGAARSVRRLRRRDGAVTLLKTAKGRTETRRSCRAPSPGRGATGAHVRRGPQARRRPH